MTEEPIRVLIVDDHALVREGLRSLLLAPKDIAVVGEAETGHDAMAQLSNREVDVILIDLRTPGMGSLETIRQVASEHRSVRIVVTGTSEENTIFSAVREGIHGYLPKDADLKSFLDVLRSVHRGEMAFPAPWVQKLLTRATAKNGSKHKSEKLTQREIEILRLLASGLEDREIARELSISKGTVRTHVSNLLPKLDCRNRVEATRWALRYGIAFLDQIPSSASSSEP